MKTGRLHGSHGDRTLNHAGRGLGRRQSFGFLYRCRWGGVPGAGQQCIAGAKDKGGRSTAEKRVSPTEAVSVSARCMVAVDGRQFSLSGLHVRLFQGIEDIGHQ